MGEPLELAPRLDLSAVQKLVTELLATDAKETTVLDAKSVAHMGALCAQAILSAAQRAKAAGGKIEIMNLSERVDDQLSSMGLTQQNLTEGHA